MTLKNDLKELDTRVTKLEDAKTLQQAGWTQKSDYWFPPKSLKLLDYSLGYSIQVATTIHKMMLNCSQSYFREYLKT